MGFIKVADVKRLHVRRVTIEEVNDNWGFCPTHLPLEIYARCNNKGIINWDFTSIYNIDELLLRGNVIVLL